MHYNRNVSVDFLLRCARAEFSHGLAPQRGIVNTSEPAGWRRGPEWEQRLTRLALSRIVVTKRRSGA
jgi:hypothetical protein